MAQVFQTIPLCLGHRGASAEAPENTVRAFARAVALGADGVELDVRASRDGAAVVFHDPTLARLAGSSARIDRLDWAALRKVRIGGEPIPLLAEALEAVGGRGLTQIEIKAQAALPAAVRAVRRARAADRVILAAFEPAVIRAAAAQAPRILRMLIAPPPRAGGPEEDALALLRAMAAAGAHGVSVHHSAVRSEKFVGLFRRRSAGLWCWTVDDGAVMRRLARLGVDGILTNDPAKLRRILG